MASVPDQSSVDALFGSAATSGPSANAAAGLPVTAPTFPDLQPPHPGEAPPSGEITLGMLRHLRMPVSVVLGRAKMRLEEIIPLGRGSVVPLNRLTGEPVEFLVGEMLVAEGEVVVANEHYAIRIGKILAQPQDLLSATIK